MNNEEIFKDLKDYIDKIKNDAINSGKKDNASISISYMGMIFDEISNSFKKGKPIDIDRISDDLDDELKLKFNKLNKLDFLMSEKILPEKLDTLSLYCNDIFMELMAGDSCAIPESFKN